MNEVASFRWFLFVSGLVTLSSCSSHPKLEVHADAASVQLISSRTGVNEASRYSMFSDPQCTKAQGHGVAATFTSDAESSKRVTTNAGKRVYFLAEHSASGTGRFEQGSLTSKLSTCRNLVSFIPQPGGRYEVRQVKIESGCRTTVRDLASEEQPSSYEFLPVPDSCL